MWSTFNIAHTHSRTWQKLVLLLLRNSINGIRYTDLMFILYPLTAKECLFFFLIKSPHGFISTCRSSHQHQVEAKLCLQGDHCPRITQISVILSPSIPVVHLSPWDLTIVHQARTAVSWCFPLSFEPPLGLAESVRKCVWTKTHAFIWRCGTRNRRDVVSWHELLSPEASAVQRSTKAPTTSPSQELLTLTNKVNSSWNNCTYE